LPGPQIEENVVNIRSRIAAAFAAIVCATGAFAQGTLVDVVEYYNATLDH